MHIDYTNYTISQLKEAFNAIDKEAFPERAQELESRIQAFQNSPQGKELYKAQLKYEKYSTFGRRFLAIILDSIFITLSVSLLFFLFSHQEERTLIEYAEYTNLKDQITEVLYVLYGVALHSFFGQTFGKMIVDVKVVDAKTEGDINFKQALLRDCVPIAGLIIGLIVLIFASGTTDVSEIPQWLLALAYGSGSIMLLWYLAEIITMLFNEKNRSLHDYIAGTVVIRTSLDEQAYRD